MTAKHIERLRAGGQTLVMTVLALTVILAAAGLAIDLSGAFRTSARQSHTTELLKDSSLTSLNMTKFSENPAEDGAAQLVDELKADGYVGDYQIWWYEVGKTELARTGHAETDRLIGVEVRLDQTYRCGIAQLMGFVDIPVGTSKAWTMIPDSTRLVWRPSVSGDAGYGRVFKGHISSDGTATSDPAVDTAWGDLPQSLRSEIEAAEGDLAGGI